MATNTLARCAAAIASGVLVMVAAAPALAHDLAADGFSAVLHAPHHDKVATDEDWPACDTVRDDAGDEADLLIKDGFDVWVFNSAPPHFDFSEGVTTMQATFLNLSADEVTVTVPGDYESWIGPAANPHLLAVSVPAGWTLVDADFNVDDDLFAVRVTHTCPGEPGEPDNPGEPDEPEATDGPEEPMKPEEPMEDEEPNEESLPVTGSATGGLLGLGAGLVIAGALAAVTAALLTARRRRHLSSLGDS